MDSAYCVISSAWVQTVEDDFHDLMMAARKKSYQGPPGRHTSPIPQPRTIRKAIELVFGAQRRSGVLDITDYGGGGDRHPAVLFVDDGRGGYVRGIGEISGLTFVPEKPKPGVGRPPSTERDMAILMAVEWFGCEYERKYGRGRYATTVRKQVCELWQKRGYRGLSGAADQEHVNGERAVRRILNGIESGGAPKGGCFLFFTGDADGCGRLVVLVEPGGSIENSLDGRLSISGPCWVWTYGDEKAQYGHYRGEGTVANPRPFTWPALEAGPLNPG